MITKKGNDNYLWWMKSKLLRLALLSSPILALYGVVPVFLVRPLSYFQLTSVFVSLTVLIYSFWLFNIYLVKRISYSSKRYAISFILTILLQMVIILLMPNLPKQPSALSFIFYPLTATFAINAIILVIIRSVILEERKDIAETEIQKLRVSNLEAQKQVLLQQLHPHFLFNALSTLKSLVREDPEEAENYTIKLSEFLRYSIQAHSNELVFLQDELQFTQYYIEMQKVRFGKAFDCNIAIPESVLQMKLPVFALQTLVENAIKHNVFTEKKPLTIHVVFENNMLKVSNNKEPKILIQKSGTGLINLKERYKLVSEKQVEIINGEKEFTVSISLLEK